MANRTDKITENNGEKICILIDGAIPLYRNVGRKAAGKKLKYRSLCLEMQRMWYTKCVIILETIMTTGTVTESLLKNVEAIPGEHHNM
jgi:hypothetical protein